MGRRSRIGGLALALTLSSAGTGCTTGEESSGPSRTQGGENTARPVVPEPTTVPTPEPTTSPPVQPAPPRSITVVMNGDILLHEGLWATAEADAERTGRGVLDFRPLLGDMRPVVSDADLAICHLETPLAPKGGPYSAYPLFSVPPAIAPAIAWEGYDACTTASNHSLDQGFEGLSRTLDDLAKAGVETAGTAATRRASRSPLILDVAGVKVGLVAATYGTNGLPLPADQPWSVPLIDTDTILSMAARARAQGAEIVMLALHWGVEYTHSPTQYQLDLAEVLTRSPDIDLVYGHHAHIVQPYDRVHGTWVVYGLGNAVAQQDTAVEGVYDGNTCRVTFEEEPNGTFEVARLEYIPTLITKYDGVHPMRWLNVPQDRDDPSFAALQAALGATENRVRQVVGSLGAFRAGVTEGE